ncbi:MAG: hypothetical protein U0V48_11485 [Anaerolineales bacterium]
MVARNYGAEVPFLRPAEISGDVSPDIEWIGFTLKKLKEMGREYDWQHSASRSPFRLLETIQRAWKEFLAEGAWTLFAQSRSAAETSAKCGSFAANA